MRRALHLAARVTAWLVGVPLFMALAAYGVLYFTTWGIPETWSVKFYVPDAPRHAAEAWCIAPRDVLPQSSVAKFLPALAVAEGPADAGRYATTIARTLESCNASRFPMLRKLRLAVQIRRRYSPDEQGVILLNVADFGRGANGIEAASAYFFDEPAQDLDPAQVAMLVGIIQRPSYDSPATHSDRALQRRNDVLKREFDAGALKKAAYLRAKAEPLGVTFSKP